MDIRRTRILVLFVAAVLALSLCACAQQVAGADMAPRVQALLDARAKAINTADEKAYSGTVDSADATLVKEEANLIRAAKPLKVRDFVLTAADVKADASGCTATVSQSYTLGGEFRTCAYPARFKLSGGKLYFEGPDFLEKAGPGVSVRYMAQNADFAARIFDTEAQALASMKNELGYTPKDAVVVKLFTDREVFLQSIKLDLPSWAGGWHEYGEAIKTYIGAYGEAPEGYAGMLRHESTHSMVSELSNDNAAYWLQEGLASVYQDALGSPGAPLIAASELSSITDFAEQETINIEGTLSNADVSRYYASSKAYAAFLLDKFGWQKMRETLEYMKKYPLIDVTAAEKIKETNERTMEAVKAVYGLDGPEAMQKAFEEWMNTKLNSK